MNKKYSTIKIVMDLICTYDGIVEAYKLRINDRNVHFGWFDSIASLREYWHKHQCILTRGFIQKDSITFVKE